MVRRGRPNEPDPRVSTTIRVSPDVIDFFKAGERHWRTRIDQALREWVSLDGKT